MKLPALLLTLALALPAHAQQQADAVARTQDIDSVVVTARKPLLVYKQTGNVAVDVEHLKFAPLFLGEKDIFKFLQLLPGITSGKDGMSGLVVRGGSNDQTQILYDDVPIYNQTHAFGLLSILSGETVQSAEV
ncbi:MAG: Plug domain-containing protein, partial [Alistipes sp.]|nr:Plug domain-containing protein [Alistipes sp.]